MSGVIGDIRHVAKARKARRCDWCGEMIEVGHPKAAWLWKDGGDAVECRMHPECHDASAETLDPADNYEFTPGSYSRGCGCENGNCECGKGGES